MATLNEELDVILSKTKLDGIELENVKEKIIDACFRHLSDELYGGGDVSHLKSFR